MSTNDRAAVIEECAQACDEISKKLFDTPPSVGEEEQNSYVNGIGRGAEKCADRIRALSPHSGPHTLSSK